MKHVVVFSGAGISAESGLKTFRGNDGLWENYKISEVATPEAWEKNPKLVLDFYNLRRKQVIEAKPNKSHLALVTLEKKYEVTIITQNIDDLHERAGSKNILHLHGELLKSRSVLNENEKYLIEGFELNYGEKCKNNQQLRPDVVWFGEAVPNMIKAVEICEKADILIIIGTSLNVYPAANIIDHVPANCEKYLIDPSNIITSGIKNLTVIKEKASIGIPILADKLLE
ncbi:MAG: NAD-dependent protein deacylase [Flavobacteriales bacterium CG_4_10_14_0_2_um_filter_32_8]|nr:MAG: NAD-dependent protein deacylase [Flavobacteriales bacterium CG_4_10_14_0_2_um_filter_32_8]PJB15744.1 MAG: NAD-dependent protein deacylase [Flavobacteriales bacterium CG_4_9_14_3_um_filter_32_8]